MANQWTFLTSITFQRQGHINWKESSFIPSPTTENKIIDTRGYLSKCLTLGQQGMTDKFDPWDQHGGREVACDYHMHIATHSQKKFVCLRLALRILQFRVKSSKCHWHRTGSASREKQRRTSCESAEADSFNAHTQRQDKSINSRPLRGCTIPGEHKTIWTLCLSSSLHQVEHRPKITESMVCGAKSYWTKKQHLRKPWYRHCWTKPLLNPRPNAVLR